MKDDKGKVIFTLLAGATAGIVTGLLLAPETGDDTRAGLRDSARRAWARLTGSALPDAATAEDKGAADRLLAGLRSSTPGAPGGFDAPETLEADSDYDGTGNDARHQAYL